MVECSSGRKDCTVFTRGTFFLDLLLIVSLPKREFEALPRGPKSLSLMVFKNKLLLLVLMKLVSVTEFFKEFFLCNRSVLRLLVATSMFAIFCSWSSNFFSIFALVEVILACRPALRFSSCSLKAKLNSSLCF